MAKKNYKVSGDYRDSNLKKFIAKIGIAPLVFILILVILGFFAVIKIYNAVSICGNLFDVTNLTLTDWLFTVPIKTDMRGILMSLLYLVVISLFLVNKYLDNKNTKYGKEHGDAEFGNPKTLNRNIADMENEFNNIILTDNVRMSLDIRDKNLFVLVIGGSGAGKTRYYVKPNLMQKNSSYIVLDPKGELTRDTAYMFENDPEYTVHILDLRELDTSEHYNPFLYITSDSDIQALASNIIANCSGDKNAGAKADPYWDSAATNLLSALFYHLWHDMREQDQTFGNIMRILRLEKLDDNQGTKQSPLDKYFWHFYKDRQEELAYKYYINYQQAPGKTRASILSVLTSKLQKFNIREMEEMTANDELDLRSMGTQKSILYIITPDNDDSFNFIVGMLYTQLFQVLEFEADYHFDGSLPIHVHFIMDEFANVALPNSFSKLISTVRSRNISISIIIQGLSQLKNLFPNEVWETVKANCDTELYLGNNEDSTFKSISEALGQETVYAKSTSNSKGNSSSSSSSEQVTGSSLLTPSQVKLFGYHHKNSAIIQTRNELPVIDTKYNLNRHPNINETADGSLGSKLFYRHKEDPNELSSCKLHYIYEYDPAKEIACIDVDSISNVDDDSKNN